MFRKIILLIALFSCSVVVTFADNVSDTQAQNVNLPGENKPLPTAHKPGPPPSTAVPKLQPTRGTMGYVIKKTHALEK